MSNWITAYFEENGVAKTGLTPLVTVYDLSDDSVDVDAQDMSEIANGLYKYDFAGFDSAKDYSGFADAASAAVDDRYIAIEFNGVATALTNIGLDHLLSAAVSGADVTDNSIFAKLVSASGTADWDDFVNTTDSLQAIKDAVIAANPQAHNATANAEIGNTTLDGGDYTNTYTDDASYYQTGPGAAVGGFGLNCNLTFGIGTGRVPIGVIVDGHFSAGGQRTVEVWAYDYILSDYIQLSNSANDFGHSPATDTNNQYAMTANMVKISDGEVSIRFTSTSETGADVWNCGHVEVSSIAQAAAGLTADAIQAAVWARTASGHDEETLGYNLSNLHILDGHIVSATDASTFVIDGTVAATGCLNGMLIVLEDKTDDHYELRRIVASVITSNSITVDRAFGFTPVADDDFYIMSTGYADVNVTHVSGTAQTPNDNGLDINALLVNLGITDARVSTLQDDMDDVVAGDKPVIEGALTIEHVLRIVLAAVAGKTTDGMTKFRDLADSKDRIVATVSSTDRAAITLDGT